MSTTPYKSGLSKKKTQCRHVKSWLNSKGTDYMRHFQHAPKILVREYRKELTKDYGDIAMTDEDLTLFIPKAIEWYLYTLPDYRKVLTALQMSDADFGRTFGYVSNLIWVNGYSRMNIVKSTIAIMKRYDKLFCLPKDE